MTAIRKKLKSNNGASIIIALLFFLFAFTLTAVIISSATANTNRIAKIREEKQVYMVTLSLCNLIKEKIKSSNISVRVSDVSYTHECLHYANKNDPSTHEPASCNVDFGLSDAIEGNDPERIFISTLYDPTKYSLSKKTVFLIKNNIEYGFDLNKASLNIDYNDTTFDMLEKVIAEMAYQISTSNDETVYRNIGCDTNDIIPNGYIISIKAEMNRNYDLSFTVGTENENISFYMTIKTRTSTSVPSFSRDEFFEKHTDSDLEYSIFFDKIQTDYKWDVITFIKGNN